jgi:hypothetical protein
MEVLPQGPFITVEETEKIIHFVSLRGFSTQQFVIVNDVHLLNHQSANKLLKTLEEPPQGVFFILITSQKARVLKTILSRSQVVRYAPLSFGDLKTLFPTVDDETLVKARGSAARVQEFDDPEANRKSEAARHLWQQMERSDFLTESSWREDWKREDWKGRDAFQRLLASWEAELVDPVLGGNLRNGSFSNKVIFEKTTFFQEIQNLREAVLAHNADPILSIENFWLNMQRFHEKTRL